MDISASLIAAGTKYQKDLLTAPLLALSRFLPFFNLRTGVQGKVVGGTLETVGEFIPYVTAKNPTDGTTIRPREWETFLGDLLKEFDPHAVLGTLYTETTSTKPDQFEIARKIAMRVMEKAGESLYRNLFTAVRNASGTSTSTLFNGFSTIVASEITATNISVANGNYVNLTLDTDNDITEANVGDVLRTLWEENLDEILKDREVLLYCPPKIVDLYKRWYQMEFGNVPWNAEYDQKILFCSDGQCKFVPLSCMNTQSFMYFTVRENMLIGVDQQSDTESLEIRRCDNPKLIQLWAKTYFGTGIDTLMKELFCAVKFAYPAV
ncbi:MAG: hypothetical protein LBC19_00535 [Tannerella sp.]|jgi:hypothetical protein|nr:hypothetical protein [Tannerella sp.]